MLENRFESNRPLLESVCPLCFSSSAMLGSKGAGLFRFFLEVLKKGYEGVCNV